MRSGRVMVVDLVPRDVDYGTHLLVSTKGNTKGDRSDREVLSQPRASLFSHTLLVIP